MKRSTINRIMQSADEMIRRHGFALPPFASWSPDAFRARRAAAARVISGRCGWDITDYGQGRFDELGLFLFTLRNGLLSDLQRGGGMCYAEKLLISRQDQLSPMHTHILKAEDIINRGGAMLVVELFGSDDRGGFAPERVFDRVRTIGNQVAASIPVALNLAAAEGRLPPGMRVLLIGTSAGVSLGGAILET